MSPSLFREPQFPFGTSVSLVEYHQRCLEYTTGVDHIFSCLNFTVPHHIENKGLANFLREPGFGHHFAILQLES
jgi:hypothetical protein